MSRKTFIWLIIGATLILVGAIIIGGLMYKLNWDFSKLSNVKYETNSHEVKEEYQNISIISATADIEFIPSKSDDTIVECYEIKNIKHLVSVEDGTLSVKVNDTRKWYEHIGIFFGSTKIKVYIPEGIYGNLKIESATGEVKVPTCFGFENISIEESTGNIKCGASAKNAVKIQTSTGKIFVESIECTSLELKTSTGHITVQDANVDGKVSLNVSTGKTTIDNVTCQSLSSSGSTGDIVLSSVISTGNLSIQRDTGDVKFDKCDASEISIKTDTGDVSGSLLSEKVFITETDTGSVDVPKTIKGGKCEIITDTGDIKISVI